jgi:hypothetical protein
MSRSPKDKNVALRGSTQDRAARWRLPARSSGTDDERFAYRRDRPWPALPRTFMLVIANVS